MTKKILIISIVFLLLINVFSGFVYADISDDVLDENGDVASATSTAKVTSSNPFSNLPEANLGLNNVLSIILICIGILLILLAIAILIKK